MKPPMMNGPPSSSCQPNKPRGVFQIEDRPVLKRRCLGAANWSTLTRSAGRVWPTPPATIAAFVGVGPVSKAGTWTHSPPPTTRPSRRSTHPLSACTPVAGGSPWEGHGVVDQHASCAG
jgi:hypothetical protein